MEDPLDGFKGAASQQGGDGGGKSLRRGEGGKERWTWSEGKGRGVELEQGRRWVKAGLDPPGRTG